jgi:hypothetical protein
VQQKNNNYPTQLFKQVLASGIKLTDEHLNNLETLLFSFPQCGVLHAIQARTGDVKKLNQAAAWFSDSATLQKVVKAPDSLPVVNAAQIIIKKATVKQQPMAPKPDVETAIVVDEPVATPQAERVIVIEVPEPEPEAVKETQSSFAGPEPQAEQLVNEKEEKIPKPIFKEEPFDETQQLIIENIAANDYFVFDKAFTERNQIEPEPYKAPFAAKPAPPLKKAVQQVPEEGGMTRYHDDKMPYSFMWWLDKTRSKHSNIYRPFANPAVTATQVPAERPVPEDNFKEAFDERKKEELVERFIQEEPQIKPPASNKLDIENKGKQSEEDHEELITETLARIYADQMLYSKAIAAYKILMLKNPEKRRYFASQIEILQKKIN